MNATLLCIVSCNERLVLNVHTGEHTQSIRSRSKDTIRGGRAEHRAKTTTSGAR